MEDEQVILLDFWASSYAMRVKIALAEKGIPYESMEENLQDKSALLLEMNPLNKSIPVLIHRGKPISESFLIIQYIDEAWNQKPPLLPADPYRRSQARFWVDYIDKKIYSAGKRMRTSKGEMAVEAAKREFIECLKALEKELNEKAYFGGENLGVVDVALVPFTCWFYSYEIFGNFSIEAECPKLVDWGRRCMGRESVSKSLPDPKKIHEYILQLRKRGLE